MTDSLPPEPPSRSLRCSHADPAGRPCRSGTACPWYVAALERVARALIDGAESGTRSSGGPIEKRVHVPVTIYDEATRLLNPPREE